MAAHSYSSIGQSGPHHSSLEEQLRIKTLIVDDSPMFLEVVQEVLEFEPLVDVVGRASDGLEAIELVARLQPELVVMDVCMTRVDGIAAASVISSLCPATKIILMSSEDSPEFRLSCLRAGAAAFIPKGRFVPEFAEALNRICIETKAADGPIQRR
jgi:DNA-binding NarL/FixJ family response regulator